LVYQFAYMINYSVTISLDKGIEEEWLTWMKEIHIPEVMETGYFLSFQIQQLLDPIVDPAMATYNVQYLCESMEKYQKYENEEAPILRKSHQERYGNRFVSFRTLLKIV